MKKYFIVGMTQNEKARGEGVKQISPFAKSMLNPQVLRLAPNTVLAYEISGTEVDDNFKNEYGNYYTYGFIEETYKVVTEHNGAKYKVIGHIEEEKIPKNAGIEVQI